MRARNAPASAASGSAAHVAADPDRTPPTVAEQPALEEATLDQAALDGIRELDPTGASNLLVQVASMYRTTVPPLLEQIRLGLERGDAQAVRLAAHTLKSSSANLGAMELAQLCGLLERAARSGQLSGDLPSAGQVQREFEAVCRALDRETQKTSP